SDRPYLSRASKCDWRAAFLRDDLIASHGADYAMPNLLDISPRRVAAGPALIGIGAACAPPAGRGRAGALLNGTADASRFRLACTSTASARSQGPERPRPGSTAAMTPRSQDALYGRFGASRKTFAPSEP